MDAASDDLTKPLGQDRPARRAPFRIARTARIASLGLALGVIGAVALAALYGDPRGGRPLARAEIASPAAIPSPAARSPAREAETGSGRREADRLEQESGVHVVRGSAGAPPSIVIEVPQAAPGLPRTPDPRLVESTRLGPLPRIGPDGARPIDAYARPVVHFPDGRPALGRIAIVVGGLGLGRPTTDAAISALPAPVSLAFAPYGTELEQDGERARRAGHETLLQIPMEPLDYPDSNPGPRTLTVAAKPAENTENLRWAMGRFTGYVALMNYMGGKLTADDKALAPILREAEQRGLGLLDDGSSSRSRIAALAGEGRVARADLVIDGTPRADLIDKALQRLETIATSGKLAVGTASALPVTIERIGIWARTLEARGILLVPVSAAMAPRRRESASR
ncbi:divergent polysaccharide deacetylase family protein [Enterovirga sp.]|uniref:divergent polysaccharide deacetylase family protein n=1 Tax=Enterovirga sp. TaxID=2026350 RepID=UPI002CD542DC|nr:divergent polysaccharide deacetylase family protein [Enterovirga sp.]HMO29558.1 divergent polysaccharide deacetylase family protein [Enterovirga sp.]